MKYIPDYVWIYLDQVPMYRYASRYWDWNIKKASLTKAICRAMEDEKCPFHIDPYESLVDKWLYFSKYDLMNDKIKNNYWWRNKLY